MDENRGSTKVRAYFSSLASEAAWVWAVLGITILFSTAVAVILSYLGLEEKLVWLITVGVIVGCIIAFHVWPATLARTRIIFPRHIRIIEELNGPCTVQPRGNTPKPVDPIEIKEERKGPSTMEVAWSGHNPKVININDFKQKKPFTFCPYCGEDLRLPETQQVCPYCKEKLVVDGLGNPPYPL